MARTVTIGRGEDCTLVLADPTVSSEHARLTWQDNGTLLLEDLGSANGTYVLGHPVRAAYIRVGDEVKLGSVTLKWSHPALREFLREGRALARANGGPLRRRLARSAGLIALALLAVIGLALIVALAFPGGRDAIRSVGDRVRGGVGR